MAANIYIYIYETCNRMRTAQDNYQKCAETAMAKDAVPKLSDLEGEQLLLNYLDEQMKPYGINDIMSNLHNALSKPKCILLLNKLVADGKIHSKVFGKSTIWVCNPATSLDVPGDVNDCDLENKLETIKLRITELKLTKYELTSYSQEYKEYIIDKQVVLEKLKDMEPTLAGKTQELESLESEYQSMLQTNADKEANGIADTQSLECLQKKCKQNNLQWKALQRCSKNCIDLLKSITDPKSAYEFDAFLYDEIGLERMCPLLTLP